VTAIRVEDLRKRYGSEEALRGISFEIEAGEVFGLLGPNGAGKTTTVEILEGYRHRDGGSVEVLGFDPQRAARRFRERIGVVLQQSQLFPNLTVHETHVLFAGYYEPPRDVDGSSGSTTSAARASASSRAASSAASTSGSRSSATLTCSSSTSRRLASTPPHAAPRGR